MDLEEVEVEELAPIRDLKVDAEESVQVQLVSVRMESTGTATANAV